jgi:Tol biopolymer transport system component
VKYTNFPGEILQPIWSPDGTHVVFTGMQKGIGRAQKDLWALRVEGNQFVGAPFPVLPDVEQIQFYNWSQNGQLAYRSGFQLGGIFVLPVDPITGKATGQPRQLVRAGGYLCIAGHQMGSKLPSYITKEGGN